MLPEISVPRLGTPGERYRDRQLAIQLPKQDLAAAYCRHLNPKHVNSADDFMTARNEIALDIGSVQDIIDTEIVSFNADVVALHVPFSGVKKHKTLACSRRSRSAARVTRCCHTAASSCQRAS